jgi:Tol biopolymer transport system component
MAGSTLLLCSASTAGAHRPRLQHVRSPIPRQTIYEIHLDGTGRRLLLAVRDTILDLSPDRTRALLARNTGAGTRRKLIAVSVATGEETGLATMPYEIETATWSPDGRTIALDVANTSGCTPPAACVFWDTWLVGADGRNLRLFATRGRWPAWSPSSRRLAFARRYAAQAGKGALTVARVPVGARRTIVPVGPISPMVWSRRGLIAYERSSGPEDTGPVRVVGVDRRFSRTMRRGWALSWAPDGRRLAFVGSGAHRGLYVVAPEGGRLRRVVAGGLAGPVWSPSGRLIAYAAKDPGQTSTGQVWIARPSGARRHRITREPVGTRILRIFWGRSGSVLYYVTVNASGA